MLVFSVSQLEVVCMRAALPLLLALVLPAGLLADKGKDKKKKPGDSAEIAALAKQKTPLTAQDKTKKKAPGHSAEIAALEQQKRKLQAEEKAELKKIEAQFQAGLASQQKPQSQNVHSEREKLKAEEHHALQRVSERYAHILSYGNIPYKVWEQLDRDKNTLHDVGHVLKTANADYGGRKAVAIRSVGAAVRILDHRLKVHHWSAVEREATVRDLAAAEADLQQPLVYSKSHYGAGTPAGMPGSQAKSDQQLAAALPVIDNMRHLILHAQWEEHQDALWADRLKKKEKADKDKVRAAYSTKLKALDYLATAKGVNAHNDQLGQQRQQATVTTRAMYAAQIKKIDDQIKQLKKK
jgi:hypothetical protein